MLASQTLRLGANLVNGRCHFRVWAPSLSELKLRLQDSEFVMHREGEYFSADLPARAGDRYGYLIDGRLIPDPVSRSLPEGVHGRSEIVDGDAFSWTDTLSQGIPWEQYILYELHVGTFTPTGTFDGVISKLDYLNDTLGITAIELMPVAAFPGDRNWGYDGASPYAVQTSYGGPDGLKRLVDAAHNKGLAVVLDVVYNHLGNEGNYLSRFGSYFTDRHHTPWGNAINFALPGVREYFVENALYWLREYHVDGLRLDAIQTIFDDSSVHVVQEIAAAAHRFGREHGRSISVVAESDENDARLFTGFGVDGFWSDDFHHAIHTVLTQEHAGYYRDFSSPAQIVTALEDGYVFQGQHFGFWNGPRGTPPNGMPLPTNVICIQNHDQIGNRAMGDRLTLLVPSSVARKGVAALLLLAPHTPLLFMGQEYDETAPFQFFTSFGDPALVEAVRRGRREEFKDFAWDQVPDPQDPLTFARSRLQWELVSPDGPMLNWYQSLIRLRRNLVFAGERTSKAELAGSILSMKVPRSDARLHVRFNLCGNVLPDADEGWQRVLYAADEGYAIAVDRL